jgi:hypothetical protein
MRLSSAAANEMIEGVAFECEDAFLGGRAPTFDSLSPHTHCQLRKIAGVGLDRYSCVAAVRWMMK